MSKAELSFIEEYNSKVDDLEVDWNVYGVIDQDEKVYSLKDDAKMVGRVFELLATPAIREIAEEFDYDVTLADSQTIYPDVTLEKKIGTDEEDSGLEKGDEILKLEGNQINNRNSVEEVLEDSSENDDLTCIVDRNGSETELSVKPAEFEKISVDIKSTYRNFYSRKYKEFEAGDVRPFTFTLGSFASFLRNFTKNIQYDYRSYSDHFVIGFLYTRNEDSKDGIIKQYENRDELVSPYLNVEFFVQEKYKIAGTSPGSGNTENIGSFKTNDIEDLRQGNGPFAELGKADYKEYWRNYPRYRSNEETFTNLDEYLEWKEG